MALRAVGWIRRCAVRKETTQALTPLGVFKTASQNPWPDTCRHCPASGNPGAAGIPGAYAWADATTVGTCSKPSWSLRGSNVGVDWFCRQIRRHPITIQGPCQARNHGGTMARNRAAIPLQGCRRRVQPHRMSCPFRHPSCRRFLYRRRLITGLSVISTEGRNLKRSLTCVRDDKRPISSRSKVKPASSFFRGFRLQDCRNDDWRGGHPIVPACTESASTVSAILR